MQTMMKHRKAIAFVLTLAMLFSIVPTAVWADDISGTTTAYVTIVDQGDFVYQGDFKVTHLPITFDDKNKNGYTDIDDALKQAHDEFYEGGAAAGYASEERSYGLSITMLWGDTSGAFGYMVNNASVSNLAAPVEDDDYIVAFVYSDQTGWSDTYSYFNDDTAVIENGLALELELHGREWADPYPLADAVITIDGEAPGYTTDENR
ncbi:MAG: hypothetical protein II242_07895, partial [Peptococcaceae bacterium]|nr:hypothetical protein [Peptococcaceae bacterium]